jgi:hypothetical protein
MHLRFDERRIRERAMLRRIGQIGCLLLTLGSVGCNLFGPQGLPPDPLFANRKPIETPAKAGPPSAIPFSEPMPAANPYAAR